MTALDDAEAENKRRNAAFEAETRRLKTAARKLSSGTTAYWRCDAIRAAIGDHLEPHHRRSPSSQLSRPGCGIVVDLTSSNLACS